VVHIDFSRNWQIVISSSDPTAALAMTELARTLKRITGQSFAVEAGQTSGAPALILSHDQQKQDGFRWQAAADRIELHGQNARGLLYAVYSFLEALGCAWVAPGPEGERIPEGTRFDLPEDVVEETPALPGRCLIIGHYAFMQNVEEWIVWAARNRLNTLFLHVIEGPMALGAAPESQWQRHKATAVPLARQRGMTIEHGGHGLADLLPRKLFKGAPGRKAMPEAFRFANGKRTPDHNFCPSSAEGLAVIRQNAAAHFRAHPEVDVFHLWPDDIQGGGWCECERCQAYTPSEQGLLAINAIAEVLEEVNPQAQVAFIAYMDTEAVPAKVQPRHNICLSWAPRSRCYAHPTDDAACGVNVPHYAETFRAQVAHFRAAGAKPPRIFEYYLDALLFKSLLPPLPAVMQQDIRFYRDAGAHTVQALMTGTRPWLTPQINVWLFARLCWDPEQDLDALLAHFCRATFGSESADLPAYYGALERAFALALDIVPAQVHFEFSGDLKQMLDNPMADMGDPAFAPPEVLRAKCEKNAAIEQLVTEAAHHLEAARATSLPDAWRTEQVAFELIRAWLRFDLARLRLYDAVAVQPVAPDARHWLEEAQSALEDVVAWGKVHLSDPRYHKNMRMMHRVLWGLRLNKIQGEHFGDRWAKIKSIGQAVGAFLTVRGIYK